jgi:peptidoglycan L-alanyl-D-glutamate endopeptidase CwlK
MPVDLTQLIPEFQAKVQTLLDQCSAAGYPMQPNEGLRPPSVQAKYWRQSRTTDQINAEIAKLNAAGGPWLAACIQNVGPQSGDPITNAIPGLSWHQWGEALDCVWIVDGKEEWSTDRLVNGKNGYQVYAHLATTLGLTAGGLWATLKDWPHVQLRSAASPLSVPLTLSEIDDAMKTRFGV